MTQQPTGMNVIETRGLTKKYRGKTVLDQLTMAVPEGSIFGFLGPNGAGKTTALRLLLGLARPTSGSAQMLGQEVTNANIAARQQIGYLPDVPNLYPWMTATQFLRFAGEMFGLRGPELDQRIQSMLALAGLNGVRTKIGGYSRGMKQRLGIAQALINSPKLLILDEPTSALDPLGRHDVIQVIGSLRGHTTVLFSTHILGDVERVCDQIAVLNQGRLVTQGATAELKARYGGTNRFFVDIAPGELEMPDLLRGERWVTGLVKAPQSGWLINASNPADASVRIPALLAANHVPLLRFEPVQTSLEQVFISLVSNTPGGPR